MIAAFMLFQHNAGQLMLIMGGRSRPWLRPLVLTVAVSRVLHGPGHPSRLILPVIRR
jgi:hypothetical protein